jgi:hypothetical protein
METTPAMDSDEKTPVGSIPVMKVAVSKDIWPDIKSHHVVRG